MTRTLQQLAELLLVRSEDEHLESKAAENRYDFEELVYYCVALANEGGGRMILGVTDSVPRQVVGTKAFEVPERTVAGIYERLHLKVACEAVAHPSGRVLISCTVASRWSAGPLQGSLHDAGGRGSGADVAGSVEAHHGRGRA